MILGSFVVNSQKKHYLCTTIDKRYAKKKGVPGFDSR